MSIDTQGPVRTRAGGMTIALQAATLGDMVAVADVDVAHGRFFQERLGKSIDVYQGYRRLLERSDVDAVTIGTPDHWQVKAPAIWRTSPCDWGASFSLIPNKKIFAVTPKRRPCCDVTSGPPTRFTRE